MASAAQVATNRRNASKSTGPKSPAAKARTRYNALKHGLSTPISVDPRTVEQIGELASGLCEDRANARERNLALRAAEAQVEVARIRRARVDLINGAARRLAGRDQHELPDELRASIAFAKQAAIVASVDRYERRSLATRNRALRQLQVLVKARRRRERIERRRELAETVGPPVHKPPPRSTDELFLQVVLRLDIPQLVRWAKAAASGGCEFTVKAPPPFRIDNIHGSVALTEADGTMHLVVTANGDTIAQDIRLVCGRGVRGSRIWLAVCPDTGRRVRSLYLMFRESQYRSRHALNLDYASKSKTTVDAHFERCGRLMERLGGAFEGGFFFEPLPPRPKNMRRATYEQICDDIKWHKVSALCDHLGWYRPWDPRCAQWPTMKKQELTFEEQQFVEEMRALTREYLKLPKPDFVPHELRPRRR